METKVTGRIVRSLSGFYDVTVDGRKIRCRGQGKLRQNHLIPLVGDEVDCLVQGDKGVICHLHPRKNTFLRPAVANLDSLVMLAAATNPVTEPFLIDRIAAVAAAQNVEFILCINKTDIDQSLSLQAIYAQVGFPVFSVSAVTGQGVDGLRRQIAGKTVAFTGNSGVGKSSLLNLLCPNLGLLTGEVSQKLGRGRHTTRHVELFALGQDTYVADTPGFSSFDPEQMAPVEKEQLQYAFPEFAPFLGQCRFRDCAHLREQGCAVRQAVEKCQVHPSRYQSYVQLYERAKEVKPWERKSP